MIINRNGVDTEATPEELAEKKHYEEEAERKLWAIPDGETKEAWYAHCVDREIKTKYDPAAETALLRQRDVKPDEWSEYYNFCEGRKVYCRERIEKYNPDYIEPKSAFGSES